ncbi:MAG TPA: DUF190 domain-containing protein [Chloroflexota bacterium]|jgi:CBS domain-containing protein
MDVVGLGKRVQIFMDESDTLHGQSLYLAVLEKLRAEGADGATAIRGLAGFGAHGRLRTARLADIAAPLPLVVTWIDAPDRVERLLPTICDMVGERLVTVEDVQLAKYPHRQLSALRASLHVGELMTRAVQVVHPDTPLAQIVDLLIEQELRAVPVLDADRHVLGIVTNGDLVERGGLPARVELLAVIAPATRHEAVARARAATAADVMTPEPTTIRSDAPIERAAEIMARRELKRLPVVDGEDRLVGILSRVDLLRALGESFPAPESTFSWVPGPRAPVGDLMSRHVPAVRAQARLAEVLDVVVSTRLNRAIVIDERGRALGVISDADVLQRLDPHLHAGLLGALMRQSRVVPKEAERITAAEMMRTPALAVTPETPIEEAARRAVESGRKVLPVVDAQGVVVGVVDRAHLLAATQFIDRRRADRRAGEKEHAERRRI